MEHRALAQHEWARLRSDEEDDRMGTGMTCTAQQVLPSCLCVPVAWVHMKGVSWHVGGFMSFVSVHVRKVVSQFVISHHTSSVNTLD